MKELISVAFLLSMFSVSAFSQPLLDTTKIKLSYNLDNYPKVDGSTSTYPLACLIACRSIGVDFEWRKDFGEGSKWVRPLFIENEVENNAKFYQNIKYSGTHSAYVNLINSDADVILVAREPSEDELKLAGEKGVKLMLQPVAIDAFIFLLNKNNPVTELTIAQIQKIYTGEITNWSSAGGPDNPITAYTRERNSGSQELMEKLVMKDLPMIKDNEMVLMGMMGPINAIGSHTWGIGYSVYYYEHFMAPNEKLKLVAVDGIEPNYENLQSRKYPFTADVYAVIREDLSTYSNAYEMYNWFTTDEGQKIIKESGYVPIK
ncbi:MAG: hypothetical protein EHM58_14490 [Ignavibacteriae bacterium]|nr:MAG: hypothetical protein EHM58_14490 [Ignavibacteriota bacterium]